MTTEAVFRGESISKPVTAWGVMTLVAAGRLDLDAPVQQYLDDWTFPMSAYDAQKVTIRQLLSNSGGLSLGIIGEEYRPQDRMPSLRTYLSREVQLVREPGTEFAYSNAGFNLLELLVEEVTGRDFAAYMAEEVLHPLGMHRSGFAWADSLEPVVPTGYDLEGAPVPVYVYPGTASGGLFADVEDVARFVQAEVADSVGHEVLSHKNIRRLHTPQLPISGLFGMVADAYALGHFVETLPNGRRAVWHGGQGHGWMTHIHAVPESGDGIVILTNSQRSWPLMAQVLTDWARWSGNEAVKMGRISDGVAVLWGFVGLIVLATLWGGGRWIRGLYRGGRQWGPLAPSSRLLRMLQLVLGIGIVAGLAWSTAQPYLMVSSIFPATVHWVGISLVGGAGVLILLALFPRRKT
jgi:CubicO group peptidase (beta-lactamase class C family)